VLDVATFIDDIRIPQITRHKEDKADISAHNREQEPDSRQMCHVLLTIVYTRATHRLCGAQCGIEGRIKSFTADECTFILIAAPTTVRWPQLMAGASTGWPQLIVAQHVSQWIGHNERERQPAQDGRTPLSPPCVWIGVAFASFAVHINA